MKRYLSILLHGKPYALNGILSFFSILFYNIFSIASLTLIIPFLEILFNQADKPLPPKPDFGAIDYFSWDGVSEIKQAFYDYIPHVIHEHGGNTVLIWFCVFLATTILLKNIFRYSGSYNMVPFEQGVIYNIRKKLFAHLSRLSLPFFTGNKKGNILNIVVSDVQIVQQSVIGTVLSVVNDPISMILVMVTLFIISWKLTLFTLIILPLTALFINFISKSLRKRARRSQERLGDLIAVLDEFISGIRIVKAFRGEAFEGTRYDKENHSYRQQMIGLRRRGDLASPMTEVISIVVIISIILYGGHLILSGSGELRGSAFIAFIAMFSQFLAPIKTFSSAVSRIQKGIASYIRIDDFLNEEETVKEKENPTPVKGFESTLEFKDVWFKYEDDDVLKGVNLKIQKGQTVALVGPSGGGKSTLADLVPRFYDPYKGGLKLDGKDLRDLTVFDLRGLMGMVTQEGVLFNDTVAANIAYGVDNPDRERVKEAARIANAAEFIVNMPDGYDTVIGERGSKLSGGQRQRLAIARAVYKNPPILILDEATSALDSESEKLVQDALDKVMAQRTSLVIAHRLSTITNADLIVVIQKGEVVEQGTHAELLAKAGLYKRLHDLQFREG